MFEKIQKGDYVCRQSRLGVTVKVPVFDVTKNEIHILYGTTLEKYDRQTGQRVKASPREYGIMLLATE